MRHVPAPLRYSHVYSRSLTPYEGKRQAALSSVLVGSNIVDHRELPADQLARDRGLATNWRGFLGCPDSCARHTDHSVAVCFRYPKPDGHA